MQRPESFNFDQLQRMAAAGFSSAQYQSLIDLAVQNGSQLAEDGFANLLATKADENQVELIRQLSLAPLPVNGQQEFERYCKGVVRGAMLQALGQEKVDLMAALRRLEPGANQEAESAISKQLVELESERRALMKS